MSKTRIKDKGSMFYGNEEEFNRYVGGYLRNYVQKSISPKYKKQTGKCENCGTKNNLESAHCHGRERPTLMKEVLEQFKKDNDYYEFSLFKFMEKFREKHYPLNEVFKILCKACHKEYDAKKK